MAITISVNKQSVEQFLSGGKLKPFIIPEYQRPYAWTEEQIETLFEDIWEFVSNSDKDNEDGTYFLGSVVFYENENGEYEIIDGQQRITSLFLLLRAIYTKLVQMEENEKSKNFINKIEPVIWKTEKHTGKAIYSEILLTSKVVNDNGNEILRKILKTGKIEEGLTDNYSKNYGIFCRLIDECSRKNPFRMYDFIYALLYQVIVLPITADSQDTALTIFSTLNDRGLPLSDADIFKAKIYNNLDEKDKKSFISNWKELEESCKDSSENIQQLFYYYMFYLRALENDKQVTTIGLRKYYSQNKFSRLFDKNILDNLKKILNIWKVVNDRVQIEERWSSNKNIRKVLDILTSYPNEFWKYPVVNFYLKYNESSEFENRFLLFLKKLLIELLTKYLVFPTVNAVKADILKLNVEIMNSIKPKFDFKEVDFKVVYNEIKNPHRSMVRMLLKLLAYDEQDELLPVKWEIEHILPVKYQSNYFFDIDHKIIKEKVETIGNKIPFEKKLNIIAGNGYFIKKKQHYAESQINMVKKFSKINCNDWNLDSIVERNIRITDRIESILMNWNTDYMNS